MTLHFSERNWPHLQGPDPRDRIFSSKALRDGRSLGDQYTPLLMLQPGRLKGLVQGPQGVRSEPEILLGLVTASLVQLTHNNAENYTDSNSYNSFYEETKFQRHLLTSWKSHPGVWL